MTLGRFLRALAVGSLGLVALAAPPAAAGPPEDGEAVIVLFRAGTDPARREEILRRSGARHARHFRRIAASTARIARGALRADLARQPDVEAVVPDRPVRAHAAGVQPAPAGVARIGAGPGALPWTGAGVGVAIVDTGLDLDHRDLLPLGAPCFTAFASCEDDSGHGTHVGGIVAARNDTRYVVGVAPGATLYAVKVLDRRGNGSDATVMAGLDWVARNAALVNPPIRVVNMSLGRPGRLDDNPALRALVRLLYDAGIAIVVSAGNDPSREVAGHVPAGYPEVVTIASTTAQAGRNSCRTLSGRIEADTASFFTSDGPLRPASDLAAGETGVIGVTISAPGAEREDVTAGCVVRARGLVSTRRGGGTTRMLGTSMAAAHVSGVVALLWEKALAAAGTLHPEEVRAILRSSADGTGTAPHDSPAIGYDFDGEREGVVSALRAVQ